MCTLAGICRALGGIYRTLGGIYRTLGGICCTFDGICCTLGGRWRGAGKFVMRIGVDPAVAGIS